METMLEPTRTTKNPRPLSISKADRKNKVRSEESINRFLLKHKDYEYINGIFTRKIMPNAKHSGIAGRLVIELGIFLKTNKIGRVYPEAHFQIGEDKRIPDVAFVKAEKIPPTGEPEKFWDFAPDLAIEVVSPTDFYQDVLEKIDDYFTAKVQQVWLINPEKETLTIYFSSLDLKILSKTDTLNCEEILPNFSLNLADIFID